MCGIIGIIGSKTLIADLMRALKILEYRGYDSAGLAAINTEGLKTCKAIGNLSALEAAIGKLDYELGGNIGIGHTRWATHGAPTLQNTHPMVTDDVALVHNGIIENYDELKKELILKGVNFISDTDSEVIVHLISLNLKNGDSFLDACSKAALKLKGSFAVAVISMHHPNTLIGFKSKMPLLIGIGKDDKKYIASDVAALSEFLDDVIYLEDRQIVEMKLDSALHIMDFKGNKVINPIHHIDKNASCNKGTFETFMMQEIYAQPKIIQDLLKMHKATNINWGEFRNICIIACGSSFYAGYIAKYLIESSFDIKVDVCIASEFIVSGSRLSNDTLYLFISQSGETADTIAACNYIKQNALKTACIVNSVNSTLARSVDYVIEMHAGREIAVAATKTFTSQITILIMICIEMSLYFESKENAVLIDQILHRLFFEVEKMDVNFIQYLEQEVRQIVSSISQYEKIIYLGKAQLYPLALEGALKLRELAYIPAFGIAAGELKHGSIALVDDKTLSIVLAPYDNTYEKMLSAVREINARDGKILLITDNDGIKRLQEFVHYSIILPDIDKFLKTIIYSLPLQLIAYHIAMVKGYDVDKPRNLAKSVTVE